MLNVTGMAEKAVFLLEKIAKSLEIIAANLDKSELEDRVAELEATVAKYPLLMEEFKKFNCGGYHD